MLDEASTLAREHFTCCICQRDHSLTSEPEQASVRPNVRRFAQERFLVWRCDHCQSLHSHGEVDLARYYRHYPFLQQKLDWLLRSAYGHLLYRLKKAGLRKGQRILDFGCGGGTLVSYLGEKGFCATGYDPYSDQHKTLETQNGLYDCIVAQDVVEHATDPLRLLRAIDDVAGPGCIIAVGTPDASSIQLADPERYVHELHQPYHRHIFSKEALCRATSRDGLSWRLETYYPTPYLNMPILSVPFLHHYMRTVDDTLDVLFDRAPNGLKLWLDPRTYALLLFGYFLCGNSDMLLIFRKEPG